MQKISFGNREYVKASEAAKRFKYTQDYVGQLCRGEKVDARLVGRVWYVNLDSISEYRKTKHATQKKASNKSQVTKPKTKAKKHPVEPVVRAKTARKLQEVFPKDALRATRHVLATYSPDKTTNIPVLNSAQSDTTEPAPKVQKKQPRVIIKVQRDTKKTTKYVAEKIPEITLQSKLKVSEDIQDLVPKSANVVVENSADSQSPAQSKKIDKATTVAESANATGKTSSNVSFHPKSVSAHKQSESTRRPRRAESAAKPKRSLLRTILVTLYLISLPLAVFFVLGVSHFSEAGSITPSSGMTFSVEIALQKVLEILP